MDRDATLKEVVVAGGDKPVRSADSSGYGKGDRGDRGIGREGTGGLRKYNNVPTKYHSGESPRDPITPYHFQHD